MWWWLIQIWLQVLGNIRKYAYNHLAEGNWFLDEMLEMAVLWAK